MTHNAAKVRGRFAPSPTGRMHFGNIATAVATWLSVKSRGGEWILRIEDLDPQRSKRRWMEQIEDDLLWLGLRWDAGGLADPAYIQSNRGGHYEEALARLKATGMTYACTCTRADIMATQAPHQSDGRVIYGGRCRPASMPCFGEEPPTPHATRLYVPDGEIEVVDGVFGRTVTNLARECGDFILRRADGAWAYQLAVVVDDALMGVTEVMRGADLLLSAAQQTYLYRLLGYDVPEFVHLPLMCNAEGRRLSKRDSAMSMEAMRSALTPEELLGRVGAALCLTATDEPVTLARLLELYERGNIKKQQTVNIDEELRVINA